MLYREPNVPRKIRKIQFGLMSPAEIANCSEFHVYKRELYKLEGEKDKKAAEGVAADPRMMRKPAPDGVLDPRLGVSNRHSTCATCNQKLNECTGHFGYIKLKLPVFHIGYFKNTLQILQCICKSCSCVLLGPGERDRFLRQFRSARLERAQRAGIFKRVIEACKKRRVCPACGAPNLTVK